MIKENINQLLDELYEMDKILTRKDEDLYKLLLDNNLVSKENIYSETLEIMEQKEEIRKTLKELVRENHGKL